MNSIDTLIIENACKIAIEHNDEKLIATNPIYNKLLSSGITREDFKTSLDFLYRKGYFGGIKTMNRENPYPFIELKFISLENYILANYDDYETIFKTVAIEIVNGCHSSNRIAEKHKISIVIVNHIVETLSRKGLIQFSHTASSNCSIYDVSPELNRVLSD